MGEELKTMEELKIIQEIKMIEEIRKVEKLDSIKALYSFQGDIPNGIITTSEHKKTKKDKKDKNVIETVNNLGSVLPIKVEPVIEDNSSTLLYLSKLNTPETPETPEIPETPGLPNTPISDNNTKVEEIKEIKEKPPETNEIPNNTDSQLEYTIRVEPQNILNNPMMTRRPMRRNSGFRMGINLMR